MNKIKLFLSLCLFLAATSLIAQDIPQAINFQAIARDANNEVLENTDIMIQLTKLDGSADGPQVYREIRSLTTNAYGSFSFQIGRDPYMANGVFSEIDWAGSHKFLKIDYDPTATLSFNLSLGTIEFVTVPYAFAAGSVTFIDAEGATDGDVLTYNAASGRFEPQAPNVGGIIEETDPTVPAWAKEEEKPSYDYSEILNTPEIPEVPANVSEFENDANYLTEETDPSVPAWAKTPNKPVYSYSEIQDTPDIPIVPTMVSDFENDAHYLTSYTETQTLADAAAKGNSVNAQIKNLTDPTEAHDAATKSYIDNKIAELDNKISTLELMMSGTLRGVFSISDSTKVRFSRGNLQYQASTDTWRFAENQWDYVGEGNANISETYDGWIDLFGWGTGNNPTNTSTINSNYSSFTDWGCNTISNGGNQANLWRSLTKDEWSFLMFNRATPSGIRYAKATVNGVAGVIILPDDWNTSYYTLSSTNSSGASFSTNTITSANWTSNFEAHGAVFLSAAGNRNGTSVNFVDTGGYYWSSTQINSYGVYDLRFGDGGPNTYSNYNGLYKGESVRLVVEE